MSETNFDLNNTSINLFDEDSSTCDDESESFDDVNSNINNRQKLVIEWMVKRETHEPHGGIISNYELIRFIILIRYDNNFFFFFCV